MAMQADASAPVRRYRIGIDVGGTFTKAVLVDNASREVVRRYSVLTTHDHPRGVAAGVVDVFRNVLSQSGVHPDEIVFLAHSTTQATNALLEGDVAKVGILGMAGANAAKLAEPQVRIEPVELAPGRVLETTNRFLQLEALTVETVAGAIEGLAGDGAQVLVASSAFGVDTTGSEELVREAAAEAGLLTTCGHEVTRLYGLTTRTRTAVINASILPRMHETANLTEASVREAGIAAPLMIMRGDGGVMHIDEMRRRPAMTMLSGPAASVAGALMHLKISDGIYFEVGGTSTNIGVIRNGRPAVTYAQVGGHETYVSSLDVRVLGVAGGSLIRIGDDGGIRDVGPRSAHIAGLPYAAFADARDLVDGTLELFEPKAGDGADHVAVRGCDGTRYALTTTCAANVLGLAQPGMHAHGNREAARLAFAPLAGRMGVTVDEAAEAVLDCATDKILPVIDALVREYRLDTDQRLLVGEGGGAAALVPHTARRADLGYEISRDAEVISSIGVALALVRDVVERIVPHPKPEDIEAIRDEAVAAVVRLGAHARSVEVTVDVDPQTHRVRATAVGAAEMAARDADGSVTEVEARKSAAQSLGLASREVDLVAAVDGFRIYQPVDGSRRVRAVDGTGAVRVRRGDARVDMVRVSTVTEEIAKGWPEDPRHAFELMVLAGGHVLDLSGLEASDQATVLVSRELESLEGDKPVALIWCSRETRNI